MNYFIVAFLLHLYKQGRTGGRLLPIGTEENMASISIPDKEHADFEEMCHCAGFTAPVNALTQTNFDEISTLDIIFSNITVLHPVSVFTNLSKLVVIDGNIDSLKGIGCLENLIELWVAECKLTNLEQLTHLRELNLADNKIDKIGNSLKCNVRLETLNLSGNKLCFLKDLIGLDLPRLKSLALADPQYHPNPMCGLCNYTTLVFIPQTVRIKKLYYTMELEIIKKTRWEVRKKLDTFQDEIQKRLIAKMRSLDFTIKEYERIFLLNNIITSRMTVNDEEDALFIANEIENSKIGNIEQVTEKICFLKTMAKQCEDIQSGYHSLYTSAAVEVDEETSQLVKLFNIELESIGTIRFQIGQPTDSWFQACQDLLLARFCANHYTDIGIIGIKMKKCTKVMNESLQVMFNNKLMANYNGKYDQSKSIIKDGESACDKKLNYLFLLLKDCDRMSTALKVIEEGCSALGDFNSPCVIKLTNSLYHLDITRLTGQSSKEMLVKLEELSCHTGSILLMKVHSAFSMEIPEGNWIFEDAEGVDVCYRTLSDVSLQKGDHSSSKSCSCDFKCYEYYAVDPDLVVPEYLIEFDYIFQTATLSPFLTLLRNGHQPIVRADKLDGESQVEVLTPRHAPASHYTWDDIEKKMCTTNLATLHEVNLNGMKIIDTPFLSPLYYLEKLTLSFNCLTDLRGISNLNKLKILDVSYNFLTTLEGLQAVPNLIKLNIGHNQLRKDEEVIAYLMTHTPSLNSLIIKENPWPAVRFTLLHSAIYNELVQKLPDLTCLDNRLIDNPFNGSTQSNRNFSMEFDFLYPRMSNTRRAPPLMPIMSIARALSLFKSSKSIHPYDITWPSKITSLDLSNLYLDKVAGVNKLENLKWACFSHNNLTSLKDIDKCLSLEELYLDNNKISDLDGLVNLKYLVSINLDHNKISSFSSGELGKLQHLQTLMSSYNQISTLDGLQNCTNLIQLYLINNKIESIFTFSMLKSLHHLSVLMVLGNPVADALDCRHTIIYNVPSILGLDGKCISSSDVSTAKQVLGGRLTLEFIKDHFKTVPVLSLVHLDLTNCSLLSVNLSNGDDLPNLRSINLEKNLLTTFSGLIRLNEIRVLCLNYNHIESLLPRPVKKSKSLDSASKTNSIDNVGDGHVMKNLEVLHLAYNEISQLERLQLHRFPSLKTLFLQGNKIKSMSGLEGLWYLEHLVLDRNQISVIRKGEIEALCWLQELHLQENMIKDLPALTGPSGLQKLFLGSNRIKNLEELFKLSKLPSLEEVSFVGNSVTRRALHRSILIHFISTLILVDGIPVTMEERFKASKYFNDAKCDGGEESPTNIFDNE
uniref:Protein phosphatase 1 regulatory subunit 7 n=1 Tax=Strigamia maritima TaxID=126957 RepID=T1J5X0_STRMM